MSDFEGTNALQESPASKITRQPAGDQATERRRTIAERIILFCGPALLCDPARAERILAWSLTGTVFFSAFFFTFPEADLAVSGWFYTQGAGFAAIHNGGLGGLRMLGRLAVAVMFFGALLFLLLRAVRHAGKAAQALRRAGFLALTMGLGPGLLVNIILKDQWGRPRPRALEQFGGEAPYTPVWQISEYCLANCSFVSGEAAGAAWLAVIGTMALARVPDRQITARRRAGLCAILWVFCILVSLNRVIFGAHFLSDVVIAWALILSVIFALHRLLFVKCATDGARAVQETAFP